MKRFTKKLIAFLGIFAAVLLALDLLSATERFRGAFAVLTDSSGYEEEAEREVSAYLAKSRMPGSYTKLPRNSQILFRCCAYASLKISSTARTLTT